MAKKFKRTIEDFSCEHCGIQVKGDGYTNHCPGCLWGKHVDINPGDRNNACQGLMRPVSMDLKAHGYVLTHQCEKCGTLKRNKASQFDNSDEIIKLSTKQ